MKYLLKEKKLLFMLAIWGAGIIIGMAGLHLYNLEPGLVGEIPKKWPNHKQFEYDNTTQNLIFFAHPHCSCSRASLNEFKKVLAKTAQTKKKCYILFYKPEKFDKSWLHSELWKEANKIPEIEIKTDREGKLASLFGVQTSGHILVYNQRGLLAFSGGITPGRAHEGDSSGKSALIELLNTGKTKTRIFDAFGCTLFHDGEHVFGND